MPNAQRRKGLRGEAEVAAIWRSHGFEVRGLEGQGDHVLIRPGPDKRRVAAVGDTLVALPSESDLTIHSEAKRQNRLRTAWIAQAEREAPAGAVPVVAWRPDGGKWWAMIPLEDLARLLA
jgi:hypothetical protein